MKSYSVTIQMKTSLAVFSYGPVYFVNNIWDLSVNFHFGNSWE